jgi:hypothetical protein
LKPHLGVKPAGKCLSETTPQGVDKRVEISVFLSQILDLADRMNHGRMMFAAETLPSRQRRVVSALHRYIAICRAIATDFELFFDFSSATYQRVVIGDGYSWNDFELTRAASSFKEHVEQDVLRERQRNLAAA